MAATRGTPEQRREQRRLRRHANRVAHIRSRAARAGSGHQQVVVATNAALAASRNIVDDARWQLAKAIAEAVEAADVPDNWKARP